MNVLYKGARLLKDMYNQLNPATLTGAIDVLVIEDEKGELSASPFHVRFGKLGVLRAKEKLVNITINDEEVDLHMKLGDQGEAFFVVETDDEELPLRLLTSPLPSRPSSPYPKDTCNNNMHLPMRDDSVGKRKRRKRRKRRSITSTQDPNNEYSQSDSEEEVMNSCTSDLSNEATIKRPEKEELNRNNMMSSPLPTLRLTKCYDSGTDSTTISICSESDREEEELTPYKRMCSVFSDSELPQDIKEDVESLADSPFSDSEVADRTSMRSPIGWDWGQLPEDKNSLTIPGQNMCKLSIEKEVRSRRVKKTTGNLDEVTTTLKSVNQEKPQSTSSLESLTAEDSKNKNKEPKEDSKPQSQSKHPSNGLYLDEILDLEPNLADLYFLSKNKEDHAREDKAGEHDNDAGHNRTPEGGGSGVSDAGIDSGTDCLISEEARFDENKLSVCSDQASMNITPLELSLCGGKIEDGKLIVEEHKFYQKLVTYEQFSENPLGIMNNSELVIRVGDRNYDWMTAGPLLLSLAIFKKPLTQECMERIVDMQINKKMQSSYGGRFWWWRRSSHRDSTGSTYSEQGSRKSKLKETEDIPDSPQQNTVNPPSSSSLEEAVTSSKQKVTKSFSATPQKTRLEDKEESSSCEDEMMRYSNNKGHQMKRAQTIQNIYPLSNTLGKQMKKTTRLTSDQLKSLNLKPGPNEISFSVTSQYQGTSRCYATVYLWKCTDKLVVSDIDGTITKSDVFGQIFPVVGKDWTQGGVAQLFHNISKNGYKFIYLSSRAIGQAGMTKGYLNWINQQGVSLPAGPLFLSPTSLMQAFHREVIEKKPEKFKIQCLRDIIALFPSESENPFTAGFGNKINDVWAYTAVGISTNRIFTINHRGELKQEDLQMYTTSYSELGDIVDTFFPALDYGHCKDFSQTHGYSAFNYWRDDIPDFTEDMNKF